MDFRLSLKKNILDVEEYVTAVQPEENARFADVSFGQKLLWQLRNVP